MRLELNSRVHRAHIELMLLYSRDTFSRATELPAARKTLPQLTVDWVPTAEQTWTMWASSNVSEYYWRYEQQHL